mgnify:CR=1 FL=1
MTDTQSIPFNVATSDEFLVLCPRADLVFYTSQLFSAGVPLGVPMSVDIILGCALIVFVRS